MSDIENPELGDIINNVYQVTRRIGAGSFGAIYEVQHIENGKMYAVKLERPTTPTPQLQYEHRIYELLSGAYAVPRVYDFWMEEKWRGMCMDRLGNSLGYYFRKCGKILTMKTVLMLAIQMICRLEYMHQRSFIHRDIKPDNFVFGIGKNSNLLYLIDLGLAKKYRDLKTHAHIIYSEDRGLAGTARYVSINVHLGVEQSCRDDLESVGYVLISLVKGRLPWQDMEVAAGNDKYELISQSKNDTAVEDLCEGLPFEFVNYMNRVRELRFDERPPYAALRMGFASLMTKFGFAYDSQFDWIVGRTQRLDSALRGLEDPNKVVIPLSSHEWKVAMKPNASPLVKPLPLFSIIHEAALFAGRSREGMEEESEDEEKKSFVEEQTMFVLNPTHTHVHDNAVSIQEYC